MSGTQVMNSCSRALFIPRRVRDEYAVHCTSFCTPHATLHGTGPFARVMGAEDSLSLVRAAWLSARAASPSVRQPFAAGAPQTALAPAAQPAQPPHAPTPHRRAPSSPNKPAKTPRLTLRCHHRTSSSFTLWSPHVSPLLHCRPRGPHGTRASLVRVARDWRHPRGLRAAAAAAPRRAPACGANINDSHRAAGRQRKAHVEASSLAGEVEGGVGAGGTSQLGNGGAGIGSRWGRGGQGSRTGGR